MANSPMGNAGRQGATQTLAVSGTSGSCSAFGAQTYQIRLVANTNCNVRIGDGAQTATTADPMLPVGWYEYVIVTPGQRLGAIRSPADGLTSATSGTLWITEMIV